MPEPGAEVRSLLDAAVDEGVFSAVVLRVEHLGGQRTLLEHVAGTLSSTPPGPPAQSETPFDLASLTKLVTATVALRMAARGELRLDAPISEVLPGRVPREHPLITARHLLDHTSGLPAWAPLWREGEVLETALTTAPVASPGERHTYSDIGFLWLGAALEEIAGDSLDVLAHREVLAPLGMRSTRYHRLPMSGDDPRREGVAATEHCPERGFLVAEVSDRNTWHLGGVGPHAGLFGPASDLARFAQGWFSAPESGYLPTSLRDEAWGPPSLPGGHVLGWDTVAPQGYTSAGRALSPDSHGHLGFSGPSLWVDPDRELAVILLCNRIHPSRDEPRLKPLRPTLHDAVARAVDSMS
ncbi:MAG: beta-lactamase family protein [Deltaproteobacteria bacterium]|nr:beta-lactamase family protein [Deltaproteobacteria bacterium]